MSGPVYATCERCGGERRVRPERGPIKALCQDCEMTERVLSQLDPQPIEPGRWVLDAHSRIHRFVPETEAA